MKIGVSELLALDAAVTETSEQYNLPIPAAAFKVIKDIKDYNKIGGLKKEVCRLAQQIFVVNGVCANQNKSLTALVTLRRYGITEDKILYLNSFLEKNVSNIDLKSRVELDH